MSIRSQRPAVAQRISGPGELVQAVPYLLGFHPTESLVLVGVHHGQLVVTARLDLVDAAVVPVLCNALVAVARGGSTQLIAAVYADVARGDRPSPMPWAQLVDQVEVQAEDAGIGVLDVLLVAGGRWWSYSCESEACCPPAGRPLPDEPSAFTTAATVAGVVALPDRTALAAQLDPDPARDRPELKRLIEAAERDYVDAILHGEGERRIRSVKRALFGAARQSAAPGWSGVVAGDLATFAVALGEIAVRDAVWMAIDDGRLDGRPLWRWLAAQLPAPCDAPALFLFGWAAWRSGDGALAGVAAERAIASDASYSAADLLLAALARGVDPRQMPRLRPRSA